MFNATAESVFLSLFLHLCGGALVAAILEQVPHHIQVVLLGRHVQRSESILQA